MTTAERVRNCVTTQVALLRSLYKKYHQPLFQKFISPCQKVGCTRIPGCNSFSHRTGKLITFEPVFLECSKMLETMYDKRFILWFISRLRQLRLSSQSAFPTKRIICSREAKNGGGGGSGCTNVFGGCLLVLIIRPYFTIVYVRFLISVKTTIYAQLRLCLAFFGLTFPTNHPFSVIAPPPPPRHHTKISTTVTKVQKMTLIQ